MDVKTLRMICNQATKRPWKDNDRGAVVSSEQVFVDIVFVDIMDESKGSRDRAICICSGATGGIFATTPRDWHNGKAIAAAVNHLDTFMELLEAAKHAVEHHDVGDCGLAQAIAAVEAIK